MNLLDSYLKEQVVVEISGNLILNGILVDKGSDLIVLFDGTNYLYIPLMHIQKIKKVDQEDDQISIDLSQGSQIDNLNETLSIRKILNNARGVFSEIVVAKKQPIHGYVVSIMNNYFVFYSPVFKTMYISLHHLKWLTPYNQQISPYALNKEYLPVNPTRIPLARTLEEQLKKLINHMVVFDLGRDNQKIGQLKAIDDSIIELITARQIKTYINVRHIKTVHLP
ncbi:DUF2642 domain-containing protein [Bacillus sp. Marseille-P3661]|uniref:DUF2642 domain-containing protein n=1 Tax=Bacillus sp. Marseille-P3661 TaxID=1936234 RepID=UPI000C852A6E|nr:DUF2642 domain-containing protein [Bacillus sp. Marseille-P3661]